MSGLSIEQAKAKLLEARKILERKEEEIIGELKGTMPVYLEWKVNEIMEDNADLVRQIPDERLKALKRNINEAIPKAVDDIVSRLRKSDEWLKCGDQSFLFHFIGSSPLWKVVQSIEQSLLPIFRSEKFDILDKYPVGRSSTIAPLSWNSFPEPYDKRLQALDDEYSKMMNEYCGTSRELQRLELVKKRQDTSARWKSL
jgi:hypothetical protein